MSTWVGLPMQTAVYPASCYNWQKYRKSIQPSEGMPWVSDCQHALPASRQMGSHLIQLDNPTNTCVNNTRQLKAPIHPYLNIYTQMSTQNNPEIHHSLYEYILHALPIFKCSIEGGLSISHLKWPTSCLLSLSAARRESLVCTVISPLLTIPPTHLPRPTLQYKPALPTYLLTYIYLPT